MRIHETNCCKKPSLVFNIYFQRFLFSVGACFKIYAFFDNRLKCQTKGYLYRTQLPIHSIQKVTTQGKILHYQHHDPALIEICINKRKLEVLCAYDILIYHGKRVSKMNNLNRIFVFCFTLQGSFLTKIWNG